MITGWSLLTGLGLREGRLVGIPGVRHAIRATSLLWRKTVTGVS